MSKEYWTRFDLQKLYRWDERIKSRQTLLNAEERGEIPKAERISRGSISVRQWHTSQLPDIGSKFGFLEKPKKQQVICIYTPKGGVLKTTLSFNLGRIFALNGIKTMLVGLDIQCSLTDASIPQKQIESLEENSDKENYGLYQFLFEEVRIENIIQKTDIPTLDVIPENSYISMLEQKLRISNRKEYQIKDKLIPQLSDYEVIIFDNNPNWSELVANALTAANLIMVPLGCDIESMRALKNNLSTIDQFKSNMKLEWDNMYLVPTRLEKTKLSQQIYGSYINEYGNLLIPIPIHHSVQGQEARVMRQSILEYAPISQLAQDYYDVVTYFWHKIYE